MLEYLLIGFAVGFIVCGWQAYKDSPWENFLWSKFSRTFIAAIIISMCFYFLSANNIIMVDNLGLVLLSVLCIERLVGEVYKGFIRKSSHAEYEKLLVKLRLPTGNYFIKLAIGLIFTAVAFLYLYGFSLLAGYLLQAFNSTPIIAGMIIGLIGGTTVAIGGAVKDAQYEGFLIRKFIRSPIVGIFGGIILINFSSVPLLISLGSIGFERVCVELYKTFIKRQVRGIFAKIKPKYSVYFKRRWMFLCLYSTGVIILLFLTLR